MGGLTAPSILVVDDEKTIRETLDWRFTEEGWQVRGAATGEEALALMDAQDFDVVVTDIVLPGVNGLALLQRAVTQDPRPAIVLITAYATVETAIEALRRGAADYVRKPFRLDELTFRVKRLIGERAPGRATVRGARERATTFDAAIIGTSAAITDIRLLITKSAATRSHVLITGESGTGKELVARAIHRTSARRAARFVPVNCAAIPETLFESQLFGHARGAFTGAVQANPGLFAAANEGTLLLDEVGELPRGLQVKLLRAIEEKAVWPVGATAPVRVDTRLIAATNRDLREEVLAGRFREDLYYRLNVVHIPVPPLRDRREDIPRLAEHFVERFNDRYGRAVREIDGHALDALVDYDWPGNVRELAHVIEGAMIAADTDVIAVADLPMHLRETRPADSLRAAVRDFERRHIEDALRRAQFDKRKAAQRLGVSLASLYRKLQDAS